MDNYYDIMLTIFNIMELKTQLVFQATCKYANNNFTIKKIKQVEINLVILTQLKFKHLDILNIVKNN